MCTSTDRLWHLATLHVCHTVLAGAAVFRLSFSTAPDLPTVLFLLIGKAILVVVSKVWVVLPRWRTVIGYNRSASKPRGSSICGHAREAFALPCLPAPALRDSPRVSTALSDISSDACSSAAAPATKAHTTKATPHSTERMVMLSDLVLLFFKV